jgi:hypothetical protein
MVMSNTSSHSANAARTDPHIIVRLAYQYNVG